MSGLILLSFFKKRLNIFTKSTPEAVAIKKDAAPRPKIHKESVVRNSEACVEAPTVRPNKMVMVSISGPLAVLAKRRVTPLSFNRLPKNSIPNKGKPEGTRKQVNNKPMMGNITFSVCDTTRGGFIRIRRSCFVVSRRMTGGWITGTKAI